MNLKHLFPFSLFKSLLFFILVFCFFIPTESWSQIEIQENLNLSQPQGFDFTCTECNLEIYPKASDFMSGQEGKVIISTRNDDNVYHTNYQKVDGKLTIKVVMSNLCVNQIVYFKVIDPDDQSPYESDTDPDDNLDVSTTAGSFGGLEEISVMPELKIFNGQQMAVAEAEFTITNQFSGDNYQILASLDNTYPEAATVESMEFIAWKRMYVELDRMYRYGATLVNHHNSDSDDDDDELFLDNVEDFYVDIDNPQEIVIFDKNGNETKVFVKGRDEQENKITVTDFQKYFPKWSGVRIVGLEDEDQVVLFSNEFISEGFGENPKGEDGGTFTEFPIWNYGESGFVPKYALFENDGTVIQYAQIWFSKYSDRDNVIYLLGAMDQNIYPGRPAYANPGLNLTPYFNEIITGSQRLKWISKVLNHEFGHHLNVDNDNHPTSHYEGFCQGIDCDDPNQDPTPCNINCVMTYCHFYDSFDSFFDNEIEKKKNCHYHIRSAILPR